MKIFGIAGFKNAGKTTLIVELIGALRQRGLRVGTVKHAHHEFDIDHPGKDSYQHREAGAEEVVVVSSRRWAHIKELDRSAEPTLTEILKHLGDLDIVLIEGYKHGSHPKLELRRSVNDAPELAGQDPSICAIVCDCVLSDPPVPVILRENLGEIADLVCNNAANADC